MLPVTSPFHQYKSSRDNTHHGTTTMVQPWRVEPWYICYGTTIYEPWWYRGWTRVHHGHSMIKNLGWYNNTEPWFQHSMTVVVEPRCHGRFCRGTSIVVNLDKSPEVRGWFSKSGSVVDNHLLTYTACTVRNPSSCVVRISPTQFMTVNSLK